MGIIRQLDDQLSNKIAAGEVVERPASVVKELVENAIDANSKRIEIHIEEAGLKKIQIIDDGNGIEEDDCLLAFERHATSKIKDENDLFRIRTLGFRGEALPSIASVSEVDLKTSTGIGAGTHVKIKGGVVEFKEASSSRKGTDISIRNLFFNTPARLKHLKTIHTELGNITDVVNRIAMAHPNVSLRLLHNEKQLLHTNGSGDVLQVLASIYGMSVAKAMIPVHWQSIDFNITGYIAKPEITRASRNYMSTIINGRFIKNYPLAKAVQSGYHTLLPIGRYPICFLNIEMDPILVDVNVHPAKLEVRLSKESELMNIVEEGIKKAFKNIQLIPEVTKKKTIEKPKDEQQKLYFEHSIPNSSGLSFLKDHDNTDKTNNAKDILFEDQSIVIDDNTSDIQSDVMAEFIHQEVREEEVHLTNTETIEPFATKKVTNEETTITKERIPSFYPIGQLHGTYILAQNENGLYIIDQHAAQERVKYEYFKEKVGEVHSEVQELLVPLTFEFTQGECILIEDSLEQLKEVGVFLESFGPQSYIVRCHPQWFPSGTETEIIEDIIEQVISNKRADIKKLREEAAIMMSCKGSIKANHHLRHDEIFALLESLRKSSDPFTCPHGRPIIVHYSTYEIEKMFKRIM